MTDFVIKILEMNEKYAKFLQMEIDVLEEIELGGA